jgi:hypothetical protein
MGSQFGMERKVRVEYPGAIYDVMNRVDHQEAIFAEKVKRCRSRVGSDYDVKGSVLDLLILLACQNRQEPVTRSINQELTRTAVS